MAKGNTPTVHAATSATQARMRIIAQDACLYCRGDVAHMHQPPGLRVIDTVRIDVAKKDRAVALFRMNRGAVIVVIKGIEQARWFWPTIEAGQAVYADYSPESLS